MAKSNGVLEMNSITKNIITAISIEICLSFLVFILFQNLFLGYYENSVDLIVWLWLPISMTVIAMYTMAWYLGKQLPANYAYKTYHGIIILFSLLIVAVLVGCFVFSLQGNNDFDDVTDVCPVLLIFLVFGSLPTLFVGHWLGKKLNKLKQ